MTIYLIEHGEYNIVDGLWTNFDEMLEWISSQTDGWTSYNETDLDAFMDKHRVIEFGDGRGPGEQLDWKEVIHQE